jgi:hypothetical protein
MDDPADPWGGRTPFLRRPAVRVAVTTIAVGSFLLVTLLSTCAPRTRAPATTTTIPGVQAADL